MHLLMEMPLAFTFQLFDLTKEQTIGWTKSQELLGWLAMSAQN
ncbi:hypothetical protein [Coleofasciculus sp. H7-2]